MGGSTVGDSAERIRKERMRYLNFAHFPFHFEALISLRQYSSANIIKLSGSPG